MPVRIALLGLAHSHVVAYAKHWLTMPERATLVAGYDHDQGRLSAASPMLLFEEETSAASLLARDDVDAVVIGTETAYHAEAVEQAAAAGKAIVLQKPMALDVPQAQRIAEAVHKAEVPFTMAWQMRVDPQNQRMRQLVRDGTLGRVFQVRRRHCLSCNLWPWIGASWHTQRELNKGMWADDAAHAMDFLYWMLGEPVSVMAEIETIRNPSVPDDHGIAIFRYADGTMAEVSSSFVASAGENTTEIVAENGVVIQNYGDGPSSSVPRPPDAPGLKWYLHAEKQWMASDLASPASQAERINALAEPLLEFLEGSRGPIATVDEGLAVQHMMQASYESAARGMRVLLHPLTDPMTPPLTQ